jgi:hypothetical protein
MVRKKYELDAPAADLFYGRPYEGLMEGVKSGQYIGLENIDGVPCHHLAFQKSEVDWQIWVEDGPKPLPRRYVITTKTMQSQPQYTVRLAMWEPEANPPAATFAFQPPPGAKRVESLPVECPAARTERANR